MAKINVEVPDPVVLALRKHVIDKYGSMRGMGKVVEEALRDYLTKSNVGIEASDTPPLKGRGLSLDD